jgi:hypothetical protein
MIEVYHRNLKQTCGIERYQARSAPRAQRNQLGPRPGVRALGRGFSSAPGEVKLVAYPLNPTYCIDLIYMHNI